IIAIVVLYRIGGWYKPKALRALIHRRNKVVQEKSTLPRKTIMWSVIILLVLIFSKYFYMASITSYFTFYLIDKFNVSVQGSQIHLFVFLFAVAAGTMIGGPIGDRIGRKYVIWASILGAAPFALMLPYADLFWTTVLSGIIGFVLASAFSAILVYAQELLPGNIGMVSGLFFGFAFGMGGIGSALLGQLADLDRGIFSGCCSLCADASLCRSFLDHRAFRYYWFRTGIGLFSDFGLCTGAAPGQYRNGFRSFLRICFWNGGYRIRTARATCRP